MLQWTWDEEKNQTFEAAQYVFLDPLAISNPNPYPYEERWQTIGLIGNVTMFVTHTWPELSLEEGIEIGRIISARKTTTSERRMYEEES